MKNSFLPNEMLGYASSALFFVFAFMIYFDLILPGRFNEYRVIISGILTLYGILRFMVTRAKRSSKKRIEKIRKHREKLDSKLNDR